MEIFQLLFSALFVIVFLIKDAELLTLTPGKSPEVAVYGQNQFTLTCRFSLDTSEALYTIELFRQRVGETASKNLITFPYNPPNRNASIYETTLSSRVNLTWSSSVNQIDVLFNSVACDDKANYIWKGSYLSQSGQADTNSSLDVTVTAKTVFSTESSLSFSPTSSVSEGDEIIFTCSGDVGNNPVGYLGWFYYLNNDTTKAINASSNATDQAPVYRPSTCSYTRTSTLKLFMVKEFNIILVRCTAQQNSFDEFGNGHKQTTNIKVNYAPRISPISGGGEFEEGVTVTWTCQADSNPPPTYYWVLPDGNETLGAKLTFSNLTLDHTGKYMCVAYNEFKGENHTVNTTKSLTVRKRTTPAPTTTTTTTSTTGVTNKEVSTQASKGTTDDSKKTTIIIAVCVSVGGAIIIAVAVVCFCKYRNKPKEIEEPPEKPRNNQDLSFYGHRPDLVSGDHGMKNNMGHSNLNSSFNNSFDSSSDIKPRNDEQLMYVDLQFDDKPRSRRPVQLLDTSSNSVSYTDIVNPRV